MSKKHEHPKFFIFFTLTISLLLVQACAGPNTIRKDGLAYLKIGDPMPKKGMTELEGRPLRDTIFKEGDYSWRGVFLDYTSGEVLVEGDFVNGKTVNRIRILTPEIKHKSGLKVGQSVEDMIKKTDTWVARPFPRYEIIEMVSKKFPRTIFLIKQSDFDFAVAKEEIPVSELKADSKVVGIVVM